MKNVEIKTSSRELRIVIGLVAERLCEKNEKNEDGILSIAATIAGAVIKHLTGEDCFPEEEIEHAGKIMDLAEVLCSFGGGTDNPGSVEEDK